CPADPDRADDLSHAWRNHHPPAPIGTLCAALTISLGSTPGPFLFLNSLYLLLKASKIIKFQGSWGTDLNPSTKFGKRSFPSPTVNTFLKDPKDLLPRQWGFKKENQVARYRTLLSVSVKKEAEAQHQDHAGQEGRETVYQGGGFGQKPHQDGSHHKSDIARARDKGHPLGGVHPFEVAPDPEQDRKSV